VADAGHHAGDLPLVDAHLDLAENVTLFGRDLTASVHEIRSREGRTANQATVTLTELERGGVAVVFATVTAGFLEQDVGAGFEPRSAIYRTPWEAEAQALAQIELYERWEQGGLVRLLRSVADLDHHLELWREDRKPGLIMLMEGADPIVEVRDLKAWWRRGVRIIGLTFGDTRYGPGVGGGGTNFRRGGLTPEGFELIEQMSELGFGWDISHLTEEGVWQGLDLGVSRICASHANARAIVPTDRHLGDEVIRAVARRDGVMGLVLYNGFLDPRWIEDRSVSVTLGKDLSRHAEHVASVGGWEHVGIGSDLDGGFGRDESPAEVETVADLGRVGAALPAEAREAVLGRNWLDFLASSLPRNPWGR
jgi:membrane dipeptidase